MIEATGLTRIFETPTGPVTALHDVSFSIGPGKLFVVCGPSGCGKSTLLNLLGVLDDPSAGALSLEGQVVSNLDANAAAAHRSLNIGFLFQDAGLIPRMALTDNIELPLVYREMDTSARRAMVQEVISRVGLGHRLSASVDTLSGGERQRAGFARAMVTNPRVLICDEPTASLDRENGDSMIALLLSEAAAGRYVICSSHDPRLMQAADTVMRLEHGRVVH